MTAMFIPTGWFPNKTLAAIASPMLTYLIPILIASQGGYLIAGKRGRIIATIAVMGAIVSHHGRSRDGRDDGHDDAHGLDARRTRRRLVDQEV